MGSGARSLYWLHMTQRTQAHLLASILAGLAAALRGMGYTLAIKDGHWSNGECIAVDPKTEEPEGGQDHRSHYGKAAGY